MVFLALLILFIVVIALLSALGTVLHWFEGLREPPPRVKKAVTPTPKTNKRQGVKTGPRTSAKQRRHNQGQHT